MKRRLSLLLAMSAAALLFTTQAACVKVNPGAIAGSNSAAGAEPLVGNWAMTRGSIQPALPSEVPAVIIDQVLPKSSTWTISSTGGGLDISYDGRKMWFNNMGISHNRNAVVATESADKKSCTFSGGGSATMSSLPAAVAMIVPSLGSIRDMTASYTDKVSVTLVSQNQVNAVITYTATASYSSSGNVKTASYQGQATYTGTRK